MNNYDPLRVLSVACPTCEASPGEHCKTASGKRRSKDDFHATRKGSVYPKFVTKRGGLSDPRRKALAVVEKLDDYLEARVCVARSNDQAASDELIRARAALVDALQEGFK